MGLNGGLSIYSEVIVTISWNIYTLSVLKKKLCFRIFENILNFDYQYIIFFVNKIYIPQFLLIEFQ